MYINRCFKDKESLKLGSDVIKCGKEDNYKNSCHGFLYDQKLQLWIVLGFNCFLVFLFYCKAISY